MPTAMAEMTELDDRLQIIDTDSHVTEPPDLWTSRIASRWGDDVPHVTTDKDTGEEWWVIGGRRVTPVALSATAGWDEPFPGFPPTIGDAVAGSYDVGERVKLLDQYGISAQVIYPNLVASFAARYFMDLDPRLSLECVRAYNDFLAEWSAESGGRLIPISALPFWDVEASVTEIERCKAMGHRGILFAVFFERVGLPNLRDPQWRPVLEAAQSLEMPLNFHIGFASATQDDKNRVVNIADIRSAVRSELVVKSGPNFLSSGQAIAVMTAGGLCHQYPNLKFVSVESGFGFVPYLLDALDWQFLNHGVRLDHPDWDLPSEYFRRQGFATMWFERVYSEQIIEWQDNVMFETDFPHFTCLWPSPHSIARPPRETVARNLGGLPEDVRRKIVHDNAAKLYDWRAS